MICPRCKHSLWHGYKLIDNAPACGCGNCGLVLYLTERLR